MNAKEIETQNDFSNIGKALKSAFSGLKLFLSKIKIVHVVLCVLVVLIGFVFSIFIGEINHGLPIFSENGGNYGKLVPLNEDAKRAYSKDGKIVFYKFTDSQLELIENVYEENATAAIVVRLKLNFSSRKMEQYDMVSSLPFSYGLLSNDDFSKKGKFRAADFDTNKHLTVNADAMEILDVNYLTRTFDISFAFPVDKNLGKLVSTPGFFIKSVIPCSIESACIVPASVGYDKSTEIPFWGFSSNGGRLQFKTSSFDFTGSSLIFPVNYSDANIPPTYEFLFYKNEDESNTQQEISVSFGGERVKIKRLTEAQINSLALKNPFSNMEVTDGREKVLSVLLKLKTKNGEKNETSKSGQIVAAPIKADPGLVLYWPKDNWRNPDYELFEWDRFPGILIFDTKNYAVQSRFFARLAFFTEKDGFKGRILSNEELAGKHDYNAHDYRAESLADFFNAFAKSRVTPNQEEILLLDILLENGVVEATNDTDNPYKAGKGAVVSISREIPSYNRKPLLTHEGFHALFFIDEGFQNFVAAVYETIDRDTHDFLIDYFKSQPTLGYDTNDRFLMHTEFMSYILQQPVNMVANYFLQKAGWGTVMRFTPELSRKMRETGAIGFEDAAVILDDYVKDRFNVECGDICLLGY